MLTSPCRCRSLSRIWTTPSGRPVSEARSATATGVPHNSSSRRCSGGSQGVRAARGSAAPTTSTTSSTKPAGLARPRVRAYSRTTGPASWSNHLSPRGLIATAPRRRSQLISDRWPWNWPGPAVPSPRPFGPPSRLPLRTPCQPSALVWLRGVVSAGEPALLQRGGHGAELGRSAPEGGPLRHLTGRRRHGAADLVLVAGLAYPPRQPRVQRPVRGNHRIRRTDLNGLNDPSCLGGRRGGAGVPADALGGRRTRCAGQHGVRLGRG